MTKKSSQGSTLIARRSDGGERGATVTAYRCVDTGSTVVTNMIKDGPRSPYTGGRMDVINAGEKMEIASSDFDPCLAHVGQCRNPQCGVMLYTAKDEVASFKDLTPHCPVCATAFAPLSAALEAAEAETAGPKKTSRTNPNADPELDDDFDGQVVLLEDDEGDAPDEEDDDDDNSDRVMVDDDGFLVNSDGDYVDAEGNTVDEPIKADDAEEESDDEDDDEKENAGELAQDKDTPTMTASLDKALLLMVNGYMQLAQDEGMKQADDFQSVVAALETASGTAKALTKQETLTPAKAFQLALAADDEDGTVAQALDTITDADKELTVAFTEASALFADRVKPETKAAWDALAAAYTVPVAETAKEPKQDANGKGDEEKSPPADDGQADKSKKDTEQAADKKPADKGDDEKVDEAVQKEDDKQAAPQGDKKPADKGDETAAAARGLGAIFNFDVTAAMDFDPRSLIITPVAPGVFGVFATVGAGITPVGTMRSESASIDNRHLYQGEGKPDVARNALLATIEQGSDYAPLGFVPITAQVEVDGVVNDHIEAEAEKLTASMQEQAGGSLEDFKQSMQIAAAGMNKGLYKNPLTASLTSELKRRGIQNAQAVANRIVTAAADDYVSGVLEKAAEFVGQSTDARNAVAKLVGEAEANLSSDDNHEEESIPATASFTTPPTEVATVAEKDNVVPLNKRNLFGDVGMGGLRA